MFETLNKSIDLSPIAGRAAGFVIIACLFNSAFAAVPAAPAAPAVAVAPAKTTAATPAKAPDNDVLRWMQMSGNKGSAEAQAQAKAAKEAKDAAIAAAAAKEAAAKELAAKDAAAKLAAAAKAQAAPPVAAARPPGVPTTLAALQPAPGATPAKLVPEAVPAAQAVPVAAAPALQVLSREQPKFPNEAQAQGINQGKVTARLFVGTDGTVTKVEIVSAQPRRVFDRSVTAAASRWKFAPTSTPQSTEVSFSFALAD